MLSLAKFIAVCVGVSVMVLASLLRENEEGSLQNRIEELWIRLDDWRGATEKWHRRLLGASAALVERLATRAFGSKLLSFRAVSVSACLALTSPLLLMSVLGPPSTFLVSTGVAMLVTAFVPILWPWASRITAAAAILGVGLFGFIFRRDLDLFVIIFGALVLSLVCGSSTLAVTRYLLRRLEASPSPWLVGIGIVMATLGLIGMIVVPLRVASLVMPIAPDMTAIGHFRQPNRWASGGCVIFSLLIAAMNVASVLLLVLFAAACSMFLLHRLAWPAIERPVYAIARHGVFQYRKSVFALGLLITSTAAPRFGELVGRVVRALKLG